MFVREILQKNLPLETFIDPDFTWLNKRNAKIYGIKFKGGDKMERVTLKRGGRHGGILGQASVIMATANGVDTQSMMEDGTELKDVTDLKKHLVANIDKLSRCLSEKLLIYGAGRSLSYGDKREVDKVVSGVKAKGNGFQDLMVALVQSEAFRTKQGRRAECCPCIQPEPRAEVCLGAPSAEFRRTSKVRRKCNAVGSLSYLMALPPTGGPNVSQASNQTSLTALIDGI